MPTTWRRSARSSGIGYKFCSAKFIGGSSNIDKFRAAKFILVASRFNESITQALVDGARKTLRRHGVPQANVRTCWVPGAFELPVAAAHVAAVERPQAIVALGCVIRGQTPQYAAIGHAVAQALAQVSVMTRIPVTFGVIVADSVAQAKDRAGGRVGNRGGEAALAALAMVDLLKKLPRKVHRPQSIVHS